MSTEDGEQKWGSVLFMMPPEGLWALIAQGHHTTDDVALS